MVQLIVAVWLVVVFLTLVMVGGVVSMVMFLVSVVFLFPVKSKAVALK